MTVDLVIFDDSSCKIFDVKTNDCILTGFRDNNVYIIDMLNLDCSTKCLNVFDETSWLWHRRLGHAFLIILLELIIRNW